MKTLYKTDTFTIMLIRHDEICTLVSYLLLLVRPVELKEILGG